MATKKLPPRSSFSFSKWLGVRFKKTASPLDLLRSIILLCALMVALIAILSHLFDENVRAFLVVVIMYAALSKE